MNRKDKAVLEKIIQYCEDVDRLIIRFGDDFDIYQSDFAYQYATNMCIIQIGELAGQLSEEFRDKHIEVPWRLIKNMCNIFAHDYGRVDHEIVWETLKTSVPELKQSCKKILSEEL